MVDGVRGPDDKDAIRTNFAARFLSVIAKEMAILAVMAVPALSMFMAFCAFFEFMPFGLFLSKESTVYFALIYGASIFPMIVFTRASVVSVLLAMPMGIISAISRYTFFFVGVPSLFIAVFRISDDGIGMANTNLMVALVLFIFALPTFIMRDF